MRKGEPRIRREYGITGDDHESALEAFEYECALCGKKDTRERRDGSGFSLSIDHDHVSGNTGLPLCNHCNLGLGLFHDDATLLLRAAEYVRLFRPQKQSR